MLPVFSIGANGTEMRIDVVVFKNERRCRKDEVSKYISYKSKVISDWLK